MASRERPNLRPSGALQRAGRALPGHPGQAHRQPAGGRLIAEQHVHQRGSRLGPRLPGEQDRVGEFEHRAQIQRPTGDHHHDQRLAQPGEFAQQGQLADGQVGMGQAAVLAAAARVFPDQGDGQVGALGVTHREVGEATVRHEQAVKAVRQHPRRADRRPSALEDPGAQQRVGVLHERSAQVDQSQVAVQREDAGVLEQHH